jgi:hypothetical protein
MPETLQAYNDEQKDATFGVLPSQSPSSRYKHSIKPATATTISCFAATQKINSKPNVNDALLHTAMTSCKWQS